MNTPSTNRATKTDVAATAASLSGHWLRPVLEAE